MNHSTSPTSNASHDARHDTPHDAPHDDPLVAYATALGVTPPDAAQQLAAALRQRAGQDDDDANIPAAHAIAALDTFLDDIAARVIADDNDTHSAPDTDTNNTPAPPRRSPAAVRFTLARHTATLLSAHPTAPANPDQAHALTAALRTHHTTHPHGVLPTHPHQEMPRQPLGALPAVLRSQFWTSAYRFGPFGNRRNSAAADESPRPNSAAAPLSPPTEPPA